MVTTLKIVIQKFLLKTKNVDWSVTVLDDTGKGCENITAIHGFTISVQVLIFPFFSCKSLLWNEQTQRADSRWQQQSYFTTTSINFSIIYFQIGIMLQLNYQWPNQVLLSRYSMVLKGILFWFTFSYDSLLLKERVPKTQGS